MGGYDRGWGGRAQTGMGRCGSLVGGVTDYASPSVKSPKGGHLRNDVSASVKSPKRWMSQRLLSSTASLSQVIEQYIHCLSQVIEQFSHCLPQVIEQLSHCLSQVIEQYSHCLSQVIEQYSQCLVSVIDHYNQCLFQVIEHYSQFPLDQRIYIAALLIPLILLSWVPNLKYLAPVSMVANVFMGLGLGITVYYLVQELPDVSSRPQYAPIIGMPQFMSIVIFAMEAIGVVMPLENHMKTPRHFLGLCGVLNQGMSGVTLIYIMLGFLGYLKYGDKTMGSITLNLPQEEIAAQIVKVLIGLAVFCTYGLQFFVCLEIAWNGIKERFSNKLVIREYFLRTLLVTLTVALAVSVPTISPFIGLIGSLCFSTLGLIIPAFIEMITFWEEGFGTGYYRIWKNVLVIVFGVMALLFGSYTSILDIVALYKP
uniref:Amino acid transporter transmembrane domain-containing protein n=1 Tax=Timema genevievae TaxID=629358 RepID=A0A7R9K9M7_TIMGE|nr:unnamed protein product [Timema genevievae]